MLVKGDQGSKVIPAYPYGLVTAAVHQKRGFSPSVGDLIPLLAGAVLSFFFEDKFEMRFGESG